MHFEDDLFYSLVEDGKNKKDYFVVDYVIDLDDKITLAVDKDHLLFESCF